MGWGATASRACGGSGRAQRVEAGVAKPAGQAGQRSMHRAGWLALALGSGASVPQMIFSMLISACSP